VSEYPVIVPAEPGGFRTATDLDILAFRFPMAGRLSPQENVSGALTPDPALGVLGDYPDMLIGEVKDGRGVQGSRAGLSHSGGQGDARWAMMGGETHMPGSDWMHAAGSCGMVFEFTTL
jgi:hypothetical protein